MDYLQVIIDKMSKDMQLARAGSQMTLGLMIARLEAIHPDIKVCIADPHSYRGYYSDIAFEKNDVNTAGTLLMQCKNAMGKVFTGYKGGDYMMGENTPCWVAYYGSCGEKLIAINDDGSIETESDE